MSHTLSPVQTIDWQTAPGHQILAAAGKKVLRPQGCFIFRVNCPRKWRSLSDKMIAIAICPSFKKQQGSFPAVPQHTLPLHKSERMTRDQIPQAFN